MDVGHAAQNLLLEAVALDLGGVPIGTIVATCAMKNYPQGGRSSTISSRFRMEEIDARLAE